MFIFLGDCRELVEQIKAFDVLIAGNQLGQKPSPAESATYRQIRNNLAGVLEGFKAIELSLCGG